MFIKLKESTDQNRAEMEVLIRDDSIVHKPLLSEGFFITEVPPEPEIPADKCAVLYGNKSTKELWWEFINKPLSEDDKLQKIQQQLNLTPPITYPVTLEEYQTNKLYELSKACKEAIYTGIDVTTSQGNEHFSLKEEDQTNLSAISIELTGGAMDFPYHADGKLCRIFSAEELSTIITAGKSHVTYNTTYCNHLYAWVKRCQTIEKVTVITYGSALPNDLQANMNTLLGNLPTIPSTLVHVDVF